MKAAEVIRRPVLTEKAAREQEMHNAYSFEVALDANKVEIRKAIETLFEVKVRGVRTKRLTKPPRRLGVRWSRPKTTKVAVVTLADGETIELI